jgi:hypothetical protein
MASNDKAPTSKASCDPGDLWCRIGDFCRNITKSADPAIFMEAAIETVDHHIPVVGPFMDLPIVDGIEKNIVKNITSTLSSNQQSKNQE